MIDSEVAGQPRKLITHSARNGHLYTMDRHNGQIIGAKPYTDVNWTRGIDQKTGKPLEYDSSKDIQTYAGTGISRRAKRSSGCARPFSAVNNFWPKLRTIRGPGSSTFRRLSGCMTVTVDRTKHNAERGLERRRVDVERAVRTDPHRRRSGTQEDQEDHPPALPDPVRARFRPARPRIPRLVRRHGRGFRRHHARATVEDQCRHPLRGAAHELRGHGKQYVAIASGASPLSKRTLANTPELKEQRNATVLYVFGL